MHLQIEVRRYNQHQLKFVLNGTRCLFHGAQCTMSPFRGSLLPTEGSILCPLLTCCRSPCPKYVRTTGRILLSNSSKCFVLFSFSEVVKRVKRSHSTCFCRVSIGHIGHIGHLRLNIDPGISRVALLSPFVFSICYRMFSICVASLASLKNSAASFLSVFFFQRRCQMVTRHMFLPCARALFTLVT